MEKNHTSSHYRQQFAAREDALTSIIVRERELFEGAGFGEPVIDTQSGNWFDRSSSNTLKGVGSS